MPAPRYQLEIQGNASNFRFDVAGTFLPRATPTFKPGADPEEMEELRWTWEAKGARLVASDGTSATFWTEFMAFVARLESRDDQPTWVRLRRDPDGADAVEWTLGPPDYERFRIEAVAVEPDPDLPQAYLYTNAAINLTISASKTFAMNGGAGSFAGVHGFEQEVAVEFDEGGFALVTYTTTVRTTPGTDARTRAETLGLIDISTFGSYYSFLTNGPSGVEVTTPDADEASSPARTPTVATGTCRIRQWGIPVGTSSPGASPTRISLNIITRTTARETITTRIATATGPGYDVWVELQRPASFDEEEIDISDSHRTARGQWVTKENRDQNEDAPGVRWKIKTRITGGHEDIDFEPVPGGFEPVEFIGAVVAWTLNAEIEVKRRGGDGLLAELPLPAVLPAPWRLIHNESSEGMPYRSVDGASEDAEEWAREASLVYRSASQPDANTSPARQMREGSSVVTHFLDPGPLDRSELGVTREHGDSS